MLLGFATREMAAQLVGEAIKASMSNLGKVDVITEDTFADCRASFIQYCKELWQGAAIKIDVVACAELGSLIAEHFSDTVRPAILSDRERQSVPDGGCDRMWRGLVARTATLRQHLKPTGILRRADAVARRWLSAQARALRAIANRSATAWQVRATSHGVEERVIVIVAEPSSQLRRFGVYRAGLTVCGPRPRVLSAILPS